MSGLRERPLGFRVFGIRRHLLAFFGSLPVFFCLGHSGGPGLRQRETRTMRPQHDACCTGENVVGDRQPDPQRPIHAGSHGGRSRTTECEVVCRHTTDCETKDPEAACRSPSQALMGKVVQGQLSRLIRLRRSATRRRPRRRECTQRSFANYQRHSPHLVDASPRRPRPNRWRR